jgi:uncharacterized membrane protein YedE/YeeE
MKTAIATFALGLLFGVGLIVSQMTNPAKIIGFLDFTGQWDPSLAFVMAGAVTVFALAYQASRRRSAPLWSTRFVEPEKRNLDAPLVAGALIFGVGWGLSGFCPGPAIVASAFGDARVWAFVAAMAAGVVTYRLTAKRTLVESAA